MRHVYNGNLRANGRFRPWITRVTVDQYFGTRSTMRHWSVEVVQSRQGPPPALPLPTGVSLIHVLSFSLALIRALIGIGAEHDSWNGLLLLARKMFRF
jgi:hypothetical protein